MDGGSDIMAGCGWSWMVGMKLMLVVGDGGKIMAGHGWWQQNYTWSWVVVGDGSRIILGRGWLWVMAAELRLVLGGCGWCRWSHDLVMPVAVSF